MDNSRFCPERRICPKQYHLLFALIRRPDLHMSRKPDRKQMVANTFFKLFTYFWSLDSCNDRRYSYFTRNFCNRCIGSLETLFGTTLEARPAIVMTIWRPGFRLQPETALH